MQSPTYLVGGVPSYGETVDKMAELWQAYFTRGDIKYSPPAAAPKAGGNRVDAMQLELEGDDGDDELLLYAVTPGGQRILICWKCCGFDHTKERCPSKRRTSKSADVKLPDPSFGTGGQSAAKGRGGGVRDRFYARRGKEKGGRGRRGNTFALECDEDGGKSATLTQMTAHPRRAHEGSHPALELHPPQSTLRNR